MMSLPRPILVLSLALCACVTSARETEFATESEYSLAVAADREGRSFELNLVSHSGRPLCIDQDQWPNSLGRLHMGSQVAHFRRPTAT